MRNFSWFSVLIIALASSLGALYIDRNLLRSTELPYHSIAERQTEVLGKYFTDSLPAFGANVNFVAASQRVRNSVVYIRTQYTSTPKNLKKYHQQTPDFDDYFSRPGQQKEASGSGVILTDDGYIATNNHVVEDASLVEVILHNKQTYKARVIGTDPTTDLALLKIEATSLPFIKYGDSDRLQVGEWVLAIGNPFDLTSTITAGIISGKGRSINILREKSNLAIESFIQTDAAVNPGNSGGALVNLKGELIGINTAIASPTGSYSGYSFAVPSDLVKKVIDDLLEFGRVQRALLGVSISEVNAELAQSLNLDKIEGVYVRSVGKGSAGQLAKIEKGDIILSINDKIVSSVPELQEIVGRFRPGNEIKIKILRSGNILEKTAKLQSEKGTTGISKKEAANPEIEIPSLGAIFSTIAPEKKNELGIQSGVEVVRITDKRLLEMGLEEGFVIHKMDKQLVKSPADVARIYESSNGGILIEGFTAEGEVRYFALVR